jgi:hypothetical protein
MVQARVRACRASLRCKLVDQLRRWRRWWYKITGVFEGGTLNLSAFDPDSVTLESTDPAVVTASMTERPGGVVTGAGGVATLVARHPESGIVSEPVPLTIKGELSRIRLEPRTARRGIGEVESVTAFAEAVPGLVEEVTQELFYRSSDPSVVVATNEPDRRSLLRTVGAGTAVVSAYDPRTGNISEPDANLTIEVLPGAIERVTIQPTVASAVVSDGFSFTAIGHYPDGRTLNVTQQVEWLSLDPGVAIASNPNGDRSFVRGVRPGTARVLAVHPSGVSSLDHGGFGFLTVKGVARLRLEPERQTVRAGTTTRLTLVADLTDGGTLNVTQRARYYGYSDSGENAIFRNAPGDRSAVQLLAPGTVHVTAVVPDEWDAHSANAIIEVVP